ncbi:Uncharacterized protein dnl_06850 [Desulfonema limicola]|uniref:Uncharacterized protein n=1 Tax=Desulfonema limicola TaxID=45656 RepID=A0A975GER4_9BACT|nr:hypothetical protein [Desulfonema limicola]QTA78463.1 Uncharacterized protein dnl_06850 [Desulfonema limicola]
MSEETIVYLDFDKEIKKYLSQNKINLERELYKEGLNVRIKYEENPMKELEGMKTRELTSAIIISSGISVYLVINAIQKIFEKKWAKDLEIKYYDIVKEKDGKLKPIPKKNQTDEIELKGPCGISFSHKKNTK